MKVSITSPLSTATPDSAMKPTAAETENGMPRSQSATMPPDSASGTALNTSSASRAEPSAANRIRKIITKQAGTTIVRRCRAEARFSNCPPQAIQYPDGKLYALRNLLLGFAHHRADVAAAHVRRHHDAALAVFAADLVGPLRERQRGHVAQGNRHARRRPALARQRHRKAEDHVGIGAQRIRQPDHDLETAVAFEHQPGLPPADRGTDHVLNGGNAQAAPRYLLLVDADFDERQPRHLLDPDVLGAIECPATRRRLRWRISASARTRRRIS